MRLRDERVDGRGDEVGTRPHLHGRSRRRAHRRGRRALPRPRSRGSRGSSASPSSRAVRGARRERRRACARRAPRAARRAGAPAGWRASARASGDALALAARRAPRRAHRESGRSGTARAADRRLAGRGAPNGRCGARRDEGRARSPGREADTAPFGGPVDPARRVEPRLAAEGDTSPRSGRRSPAMTRRTVDFPAPDGPDQRERLRSDASRQLECASKERRGWVKI